MTCLDALGPASMLCELRGYAGWLEAAGEDDDEAVLSRLLSRKAPDLPG